MTMRDGHETRERPTGVLASALASGLASVLASVLAYTDLGEFVLATLLVLPVLPVLALAVLLVIAHGTILRRTLRRTLRALLLRCTCTDGRRWRRRRSLSRMWRERSC